MSAETVETLKAARELTRLCTAFGMRSFIFYTSTIPAHIVHGLDAEEVR